jgi:hypothetical protein
MMAGLAGRGAAWGSVLSADGFAAIRSVGFEPVGQVFGAAVYPLTATAALSCPGTATPYLVPGASARVTGVSGAGARIAQALYDGRRVAIDRMAGECSDLGGHGVVGAVLADQRKAARSPGCLAVLPLDAKSPPRLRFGQVRSER